MGHVCPWWHVYSFDNPLRRLVHNPWTMFEPYVKAGMTAMDVGCGRGFFSIALAHMVGSQGRVISVDLQPQMLNMLRKRAERAGLADLIVLHQCEADTLGVDDTVDFVNAFWMVHEVPDISGFLHQVMACLRPAGKFLVAEPRFHVSEESFQETLAMAEEAGLEVHDRPHVRFSRAAVFARQP